MKVALSIITVFVSGLLGNGYGQSIDFFQVSPRDVRVAIRPAVTSIPNAAVSREFYLEHSEDLREWFAAQPWYEPVDGEVTISDLERANVEVLSFHERRLSQVELPVLGDFIRSPAPSWATRPARR